MKLKDMMTKKVHTHQSGGAMDAASSGFVSMVKQTQVDICSELICSGKLDEAKSMISNNPELLHQTASNGNTLLLDAVVCGKIDAVKFLIAHGISVNQTDQCGRTPLAISCYQGWYDGVLALLSAGANALIADEKKRLPIMATTYDPNIRCMALLLRNITTKSILNTQDSEDMAPLHWASYHNRPEHVQLLISKGANFQLTDCDNKTPLHWACQNGCTECVDILVRESRGTNLVNMRDRSGKGALHYAAAAGHLNVIESLSKTKTLNVCLDDPEDRQPLHWAAAMGRLEAVKLLLKMGANPSVLDKRAKNAYHYASQAQHEECAAVLKEELDRLLRERELAATSQRAAQAASTAQKSEHINNIPEISDADSVDTTDQTVSKSISSVKTKLAISATSQISMKTTTTSLHSTVHYEQVEPVSEVNPNPSNKARPPKLPPLKNTPTNTVQLLYTEIDETELPADTQPSNKGVKRTTQRKDVRMNKSLKFVPPVGLYSGEPDDQENLDSSEIHKL